MQNRRGDGEGEGGLGERGGGVARGGTTEKNVSLYCYSFLSHLQVLKLPDLRSRASLTFFTFALVFSCSTSGVKKTRLV